MIIQNEQIEKSIKYFTSQPESKLALLAIEMNRKHRPLSMVMKALESNGINGYIIDELMLGILEIWYVIEKINMKRISPITDEDIQNTYNHFNSFLKFYNKFEDEKELKYFPYEKNLEIFIVNLFKKIYLSPENIPKEVILIYYSIMKCFENKLGYTRNTQ